MAGLARIAKLYGSIVVNGEKFVWDYIADKAVPEAEMPFGSERHKFSERARFKRTPMQCQARGCDGCSVCDPANAEVS